jgi:hypothetical protein
MQLRQVAVLRLPARKAGGCRGEAAQTEEAGPALGCALIGEVLHYPG